MRTARKRIWSSETAAIRRLGRPAAALLLVVMFGCERQIFLPDPALEISGYGIRGHVLDRLGNPVPGIDVLLDYDVRYVDGGPPPERVLTVPAGGWTVTVDVLNREGRRYRLLGTVAAEPGPFTYTWDETSDLGTDAPSGVYYMRFRTDTTTRLTYPIVVFDRRVAITDAAGLFSIPDVNLPVDFYPVPAYDVSGTTFYGNYQITNRVYVGFVAPGGTFYRQVDLERDVLSEFDVRLN